MWILDQVGDLLNLEMVSLISLEATGESASTHIPPFVLVAWIGDEQYKIYYGTEAECRAWIAALAGNLGVS